MEMISHQVGIDVAKNELVTSIQAGKAFALPNTVEGCQELVGCLPEGSVVHLEASGGYERLVRRMLEASGFKVVLHNPLKPRRLAQAQGIRAKTDFVDARVLSQSGALLPESPTKTLDRQALADHSRAIDTLKETIADYKKRMKGPELDPVARQIYAQSISVIQKQLEIAEKAFAERIKASGYALSFSWVCSVPALGPSTARICICEFPEDLMLRSTAQIASYAGLAPIDNQSGNRIGRAHLGHGNNRLKRAFYMPAICAVRTQQWAKELYARLRAKGRAHQSAIVAVMRRLLVRAVAVLKRGSPWQDEPITT